MKQTYWSGILYLPMLFLNVGVHAGFDLNGFNENFIPLHGSNKELPASLKPCHRKHKKFNMCLKSSLQTFLREIIPGNENLHIPSTDPLHVPYLKISEGSGNVELNLEFKDMNIFGLGEAKVMSVRSNLEDYKFEVTVKYPTLNTVGFYNATGGVLTFPIVGQGEFYLNLTDVSTAWILYFSETESFNGQKYFAIDHFFIDIIPTDISINFGETIDGDRKLGAAVNVFLNENAQEIFKLTKPKITDALSSIFSSIANRIFSNFPINVLLPR